MIVRAGRGFELRTRDGRRLLGRHPSYARALAQERAIEAHKHARGNPASDYLTELDPAKAGSWGPVIFDAATGAKRWSDRLQRLDPSTDAPLYLGGTAHALDAAIRPIARMAKGRPDGAFRRKLHDAHGVAARCLAIARRDDGADERAWRRLRPAALRKTVEANERLIRLGPRDASEAFEEARQVVLASPYATDKPFDLLAKGLRALGDTVYRLGYLDLGLELVRVSDLV